MTAPLLAFDASRLPADPEHLRERLFRNLRRIVHDLASLEGKSPLQILEAAHRAESEEIEAARVASTPPSFSPREARMLEAVVEGLVRTTGETYSTTMDLVSKWAGTTNDRDEGQPW